MTMVDAKMKARNPDAAVFLENAIKKYVATTPGNRLPAFDNDPIYDEPLVGFADGDDPIFSEYKRVIGPYHLTPREVVDMHSREKGLNRTQPRKITVISFVLPITYATRLSLRKETLIPSLRWNHTRWYGEELLDQLSEHLVTALGELGCDGVVPHKTGFYKGIETSQGRSSNWSQRHIAYAAGLGTFSLNDGFITPKGMAMRCGSVVTTIPIQARPRPYKNHLANCLFYLDKSCRVCIDRCPAGAVTEAGHDKVKCRDFLQNEQKALIKQMGKEEGYIGRYHGCGLCQVKVPCESRIPPKVAGRNLK
ncbi:MAG: epoxyqueuosine reductase [Chloroflexi bacterium]|nr:epoxyqueuosine reductase [Chloroflexota bacterium]